MQKERQTTSLTLPLGTTVAGEPFVLPLEAATQKFAFLARSGAGKTYAATKLAELMHDAHIPIVVLDPVGVWYGLRLAADGVSPGLPIPVFGGEHGDIPLLPQGGGVVADVIVDRQLSVILDVSNFRKHERKTFVTELAEQLFHRKKTARSPLHLFLEEAHSFVPQKTFHGDERMFGAFEDISKIGRNYGIGLSLISQRPQSVNKDVLNMAEVLVVLQTNAAQERKVIRDWVAGQGIEAVDAVNNLPQLAIGEAYVWSPQWLRYFGKVRIGQKWTYNASATPTFDTVTVAPRSLAANDLDALRTAMQQIVQQAEERDPHVLRQRIAALERELAAHTLTAPVERVVEILVPVLTDEQLRILTEASVRAEQTAQVAEQAARELHTLVATLRGELARMARGPMAVNVPHTNGASTAVAPSRMENELVADEGVTSTDVRELTAAQQRMLTALASFEQLGVMQIERGNLAAWSDQSPKSSAFDAHLRQLRAWDYIRVPQSGWLALTEAGRSRADADTAPPTLAGLHQAWYAKLDRSPTAMLRVLVAAYPKSVAREVLAEQTGQSPKSSAFDGHVRQLRSLGLLAIQPDKQVVATQLLFPTVLAQ